MTVQLLANALLIVALLCWIGYRQVTWQPVSIARMWRMPIVLGLVGLFTLTGGSVVIHLTTLDLAIFLIEIVISLGVGAAMGAMATFRPLSREAAEAKASRSARRGGGLVPTLESRTGWIGLVLWIVLIAVRVGLDVYATSLGSQLAASAGMIFIMFAANRAARVLVFAYRVDRLSPVAAA